MTDGAAAALPRPPGGDLLGVRSSKGRYYSEYRHSAQDLQRTLLAVNALSWVLADASGGARSLAEGTLPVIARLLSAQAVVLVTAHPGLGGERVCLRSPDGNDLDPRTAALLAGLARHAEQVAEGCPPAGLLRHLPDLGSALLLAPLPRSGRGDGYVAAAVPLALRPDGNDVAILGALTNQLAGAIESSRRLAESEASRRAADEARRAADEQSGVLARRNAQLRQTRHELVAARERQVLAEERQRIARDLHDSVAQHVLSMGMQVEWCRTTSTEAAVVERLAEVKALARSTVDRIRAAIYALSSGDELQAHGLGGALRRLGEQHRVHGLAIHVDVPTRADGTGDAEGDRLPAPVERVLYMVVKEALFNAVLHAEGASARVVLRRESGQVHVEVSDDGQGTAADLAVQLERSRRRCAGGSHRGLVNMEERLLQVGGRLSLHDCPGGGVAVRATVPVGRAGR